MLERLRTWLNDKREYNSGVAIFAALSNKEHLISVFSKGYNEFRERRLQEELLLIYKKHKEEQNEKTTKILSSTTTTTGCSKNENTAIGNSQVIEENGKPVNETLYHSCKLAADKLYKQTMNDRAILFALTKCESFENTNLPHKINERAKLAIDVVTNFQKLSELYDQADYVKVHGHLPDQSEAAEENTYDHLTDSLVKQTLDNLRKNYNKIKTREQTPERVALLQRHEKNIKKLEARWLLLKPK